jgi:hypothetical protein
MMQVRSTTAQAVVQAAALAKRGHAHFSPGVPAEAKSLTVMGEDNMRSEVQLPRN